MNLNSTPFQKAVKTATAIFMLLLTGSLYAATLTKSLYIDFGVNNGMYTTPGGVFTTSPDANGNYWNNFANWDTPANPAASLVSSTNEATGFSISLTRAFSTSASGYTNGGFTVSDASSPVKNLLTEFQIPTAGYDFFYTSNSSSTTGPQLKFTGLNANRAYKFKIFASRVNTQTRITNYSLVGATTVTGNLQTSGVDLGGAGLNLNNSTMLTLDNVNPNASGELLLNVWVNAGAGYINFLKIEEYDTSTNLEGVLVKSNVFVQNGNIAIDATALSGKTDVCIYNANGVMVKSISAANNELMNFTAPAKGVYFVQLKNAENPATHKVVVL